MRSKDTLRKLYKLVTTLDGSLWRPSKRTDPDSEGGGGGRKKESFGSYSDAAGRSGAAGSADLERRERFARVMATKFDKTVDEIERCLKNGLCFKHGVKHRYGSAECKAMHAAENK